VINWNNYDDTRECLVSLKGVLYQDYTVVVIDNSSSDSSDEKIRKEFPEFIHIRNHENLGFAEGNNIGIERAMHDGADYVWILNNDVTVKPDSLTELVSAAKTYDKIGILGPKVYYYHDTQKIFSAGAKIIRWSGRSVSLGQNEYDEGQYDKAGPADYISGCSLFASVKMFRDIGLFDVRYFMYYEETDLAVRARKRGWKVMYIPKSIVLHKHASTVKKLSLLSDYYICRNNLLFVWKNYRLFFISAFIRSLRYDIVGHLFGLRIPNLFNSLTAYRDFICGNFGRRREEFAP